MFTSITAKIPVQDYHIRRTRLSHSMYKIITFGVQDYHIWVDRCTRLSHFFTLDLEIHFLWRRLPMLEHFAQAGKYGFFQTV